MPDQFSVLFWEYLKCNYWLARGFLRFVPSKRSELPFARVSGPCQGLCARFEVLIKEGGLCPTCPWPWHLAGVMVLTGLKFTSFKSYLVHNGWVQVCLKCSLSLWVCSILRWIENGRHNLTPFCFRDYEEILTGEALRAHVTFILFPVTHRILSQSGE